ncbi:MAG TPA: hypothetical protein VFL16_04660 [Steroidobacteraceae bacterium]|nr:hypothetical protein [Steroidobacteraceae bacterium]
MDQAVRLSLTPGAKRCRRKFLEYFPDGFHDADYLEFERDYKVETHRRWEEALNAREFRSLLAAGAHAEIAARAVRVEQRSRHSMIFSFEKMALRDAVRTPAGARAFATGLFDLLHGRGSLQRRFERWIAVVAGLPRRQTRVLTWPLVTVFGFIARPDQHVFLKPTVTRAAARAYGFEFNYASRPSWPVYQSLLQFADRVRRDTRDLGPRDMIDAQSFIWVQGSDEY